MPQNMFFEKNRLKKHEYIWLIEQNTLPLQPQISDNKTEKQNKRCACSSVGRASDS